MFFRKPESIIFGPNQHPLSTWTIAANGAFTFQSPNFVELYSPLVNGIFISFTAGSAATIHSDFWIRLGMLPSVQEGARGDDMLIPLTNFANATDLALSFPMIPMHAAIYRVAVAVNSASSGVNTIAVQFV